MGSRLGLCVIEDTIYIIGETSIEKYDVKQNLWSDVTDLPTKRSFTRSVAALDGKIYIMGGTNNINWYDEDDCYYDNIDSDYENYINSVDCFDTVTNTWIREAFKKIKSVDFFHTRGGCGPPLTCPLPVPYFYTIELNLLEICLV